jgi:hypothetical protein
MGEVYQARDTRLERAVAIKILPSHLSSDPDRRQRFEREAKAISSLQHPNICVLHDVGRQETPGGPLDFLVMEYLEGESLSERIAKGALPSQLILRYGVQIADALDKAHRSGIVHRDLKPANVVLTKAGAKLLDFGLAKHVADSPLISRPPAGVSSLPTRGQPLTGEGTLLGTLQYMAPEQLEGKEADSRTDIFALGALLHEMATGQAAFAGKSQASLIAAILDSEPPAVSSLQPMAPAALDHVVRTCLAKDPDERWQTAHDVMAELKWIAELGSQAGARAETGARPARRGWLLLAGAALASLAFGLWMGGFRARTDGYTVLNFHGDQVTGLETRGGYDYVDLARPTRGAPPPASCSGMSGAGVWYVNDNKARLGGVAFYELATGLRSHGPESVYGRLLEASGLVK